MVYLIERLVMGCAGESEEGVLDEFCGGGGGGGGGFH